MDRINNQREVLVRCPECMRVFNAERVFWTEPVFAKVPLHCPTCHTEFTPDRAEQVWGA
jgi:hypothetical protein